MSLMIDILPGLVESQYDYEIRISDEAIQCLDSSAILKAIDSTKNLVKFYLDRKLTLEECNAILRKLEDIAGENGSISIYTSGRNFNELMKCIKFRKSVIHHELHIDDDDIRNILDVNNIICGLNFSRISCDCYFSDRYLVNFNPGDYVSLCRFPECKFDRNRIDKMRLAIEEVWHELVPSIYYANALTSFEKIEMVMDYIKERIATTTDAREVAVDDITYFSRKNYQAVDYAEDAIGTFQEKNGTAAGKTRLAALLLDNYFAKVNCRIVDGRKYPTGDSSIWLVTVNNGGEYGHSLYGDIRFKNLEELGYVDGIVSLDNDHKYRNDFSYMVDGYSELDEITYFNLKSSVDAARKTFVFPPKIIGESAWNIEDFAEDIYQNVGTKSNKKLQISQDFKVKSASRNMDKVHIKRLFPERFSKSKWRNINKN